MGWGKKKKKKQTNKQKNKILILSILNKIKYRNNIEAKGKRYKK